GQRVVARIVGGGDRLQVVARRRDRQRIGAQHLPVELVVGEGDGLALGVLELGPVVVGVILVLLPRATRIDRGFRAVELVVFGSSTPGLGVDLGGPVVVGVVFVGRGVAQRVLDLD